MNATLIHLNTYRNRQSKRRILEAITHFQEELLTPLPGEAPLDADELEECLAHILGEHLVDKLHSVQEPDRLHAAFRRFSRRLKQCLKLKLSTRRRFDSLMPSEHSTGSQEASS